MVTKMRVGKIGTGIFLLGLTAACANQAEQPKDKYEPRVPRAPVAGAAKKGFYVNFDTIEVCHVGEGFHMGYNVACHTRKLESEVDDYGKIRALAYLSNGVFTSERLRVADHISGSLTTGERPRDAVPSDRETHNLIRTDSVEAKDAEAFHYGVEGRVLHARNYVGDMTFWPRIVDIEQGRLFPERPQQMR